MDLPPEIGAVRQPHLPALLGGGFLVIAVIGLLTGWAILQGRADARRAAEITTANLSQILADNFSSTIQRIDLGMLAILDEIVRQQVAGGRDDGRLIAAVAREDARHPDSLGFRVVGPDGKLRCGISNVGNPDGDISGRADFQYLRDHPAGGLLVNRPVLGLVTQRWQVGLARRITNPDGSFGGAVYSAIPSKALEKAFDALNLGPGGMVALRHTNLQLAARFPVLVSPNEAMGSAVVSDQVKAIVASGVASIQYEYISPLDGVARTAHFRQVEGWPYFVVVGLASDDYLADWRRHRDQFLLFGGLMVALVLVGMQILHRRIVDWQRATDSLAEKTKLLSQSNADLEQFAYVASHDLRTPLRNIVSYAQLLDHRYKGRIDADADDFIGFIVEGGKRMTRLITDLLEYSRVARPSQPLRSLPAAAAVAHALANLALDIEEAGAEVKVGKLPNVMAEQSQLVSLFQNLVGNAIKYRAPERPAKIAVTATRVDAAHWRFAVADNGIGIEPQYHDKIFEIFQRLDPAGDAEGTGIGLTLCRRIVNRFGGIIRLESTFGEGTTMLFTLRDGGAGSAG